MTASRDEMTGNAESRMENLISKLHDLKKGERVVYHRGFLAYDRSRFDHLHALAKEVWGLALKGSICLAQKRIREPVEGLNWRNRVGPGFEYIAIGA